MAKQYITKEGLEKVKKELADLKNNKRKEIAERLRYTSSFGDLKENAAYHEARDAQGFLEGRIQELEEIVRSAKIIEKGSGATVEIGSTVTIESSYAKASEDKETFTIVGPAEADPMSGKISAESPLGKALLDRKEGDDFSFQSPEGKIEYKVLKIE